MDKTYEIENITKISLRDLSDRSDKCVSQLSYVLTQMALLDVDITAYARKIARREANINARMSTTKRWEAKDAYAADEEWCRLADAYDKRAGTKGVLNALAKSLEEKIKLYSRDLTRRGVEVKI